MDNNQNDDITIGSDIIQKTLLFIKNRPILTYNIITTIGLCIVFLYFIRISYLPSLFIEEILLLILISSLIGGVLFFALYIYLVAPVFFYTYARVTEFKDIIYFENDNKKTFYRDLIAIILPMFIMLSCVILDNRFPKFFLTLLGENKNIIYILIHFIFVALISFFLFRSHDSPFKKAFIYLINLVMCELLLLSSIIVYYAYLKNTEIMIEGDFVSFFTTFFLVFLVFFVVNTQNTLNITKKIVLNLICFIGLVMFTNSYYVVPYKIMQILNLGKIPIETMFLSKEGCQIIELHTKNNCVIEKYDLLWRLGNNYVIQKEISKTETEIKYERYYIPKKYVLSWKQISQVKIKKVKIDNANSQESTINQPKS